MTTLRNLVAGAINKISSWAVTTADLTQVHKTKGDLRSGIKGVMVDLNFLVLEFINDVGFTFVGVVLDHNGWFQVLEHTNV
jgi:hypothetical protein